MSGHTSAHDQANKIVTHIGHLNGEGIQKERWGEGKDFWVSLYNIAGKPREAEGRPRSLHLPFGLDKAVRRSVHSTIMEIYCRRFQRGEVIRVSGRGSVQPPLE